MHQSIVRFSTFLFCAAGALGSSVSGQSALLDEIQATHQLAGLSVVTRCGDAISIDHHSGYRNIAEELPVNGETVYRIASISKAVVALAAAKLAEQGTLDLDAPIGSLLEDPPYNPAHPDQDLTMRHLLTHTSGIRDGTGYGDFLSATYSMAPDVPTLNSVLDSGGPYHTDNMWGDAPPGQWFQYANLNFGVAATVMEAAAGMRFDLLMQALLFEPFGLDGGFKVQDLSEIGDLAVLYRQVNGAWVPQADDHGGQMPDGPDWEAYTPGTNAVGFAPQGGLRISARDLTVLARLWSTGMAPDANGVPLIFISPSTLADLHAIRWTMDGDDPNGNNYYGLFNQWSSGLHLAASGFGDDEVIPEVPVSPFIGHPGEAYGLISDAYATPGGEWNFAFISSGKWEGYSNGPASAFYAVEQAVFSALREDLLQCLTAKVPEVAVDLSVVGWPRVGDTLVELRAPGWSGPVDFELVDASGRRLSSGPVITAEQDRLLLDVQPLPGGLIFGQLVHRVTGTGVHPRGESGRFIMLVTG